jgi:hypothetical protein
VADSIAPTRAPSDGLAMDGRTEGVSFWLGCSDARRCAEKKEGFGAGHLSQVPYANQVVLDTFLYGNV